MPGARPLEPLAPQSKTSACLPAGKGNRWASPDAQAWALQSATTFTTRPEANSTTPSALAKSV